MPVTCACPPLAPGRRLGALPGAGMLRAEVPPARMADATPDPLAPATLVERYGERLFRLARRLTGSDADAEDVAQSTLLKVLQRAQDFRGESDPFGWIYRIALNEARELHRRRARRPAVSLEGLPLPLREDGHLDRRIRTAPVAVDRAALARESEARIRAAIEELPDGYREAVVLIDLEGLTYPQAAELLGLHLNAFKTRLHRARLHLRNRLEDLWKERADAARDAEEPT